MNYIRPKSGKRSSIIKHSVSNIVNVSYKIIIVNSLFGSYVYATLLSIFRGYLRYLRFGSSIVVVILDQVITSLAFVIAIFLIREVLIIAINTIVIGGTLYSLRKRLTRLRIIKSFSFVYLYFSDTIDLILFRIEYTYNGFAFETDEVAQLGAGVNKYFTIMLQRDRNIYSASKDMFGRKIQFNTFSKLLRCLLIL